MPSFTSGQPEFSIGEARAIVKDLFEPRPLVYWMDFLACMTIGLLGFTLYQFHPDWRWQLAGYLVTVPAFYRAALFTHEMVHFRENSFRGFRIAWNVLCGIPFLIPSFMYYTHLAHHSRKHYGTRDDGEYLALGASPLWELVKYFLQIPLIPIVGAVRFFVAAPLSWICPPVRCWLIRHASSMVMDPSYLRPVPTPAEARIWRLQEVGCFLVGVNLAVMVALGYFTWAYLAKIYLLALGVISVNHVRTLGAHRFVNRGGEMTFVEQLVDSLNYPNRPWLTELWAPIGLRFHALHHLFPSMPYHNLERAHWRLMSHLPADSPYRLTVRSGLFAALGELLQNAVASRRKPAIEAGESPRLRNAEPLGAKVETADSATSSTA